MKNLPQWILVFFAACITILGVMCYKKLDQIEYMNIAQKDRLIEIAKDIQQVKDNQNISTTSVWWITSYPKNVAGNIDDISYNVSEILEAIKWIDKWRTDFTALYMNANYNALKPYLNTIAK